MSATVTPTLVPARDGSAELSFGRPMFKIGSGDDSTGLGLIDVTLAPGGGFSFPQVHEDLEEAFSVLEGELDYLLGDAWVTCRPRLHGVHPGQLCACVRNASDRAARQLVIGSSSEMLGLIRGLGSSPRDRWDEICARSRTRLVYASPHFPRP